MNTNVKSVLAANQTCSTKCRSKTHRNSCFAALTQNVDDEEILKGFLLSTCQNFWRSVDDAGRSLTHWSASCGKVKILEWLLENFQADFVNSKDTESGYTPLHRAFLYGQIACAQVLLKVKLKFKTVFFDYKFLNCILFKYGASLNVLDQEYLTPIDILQKNSIVGHFSVNGR